MIHTLVRQKSFCAILACLCAWPAANVLAQATDRPLRIILPVGAGSGVDVNTRSMTNALSRALGGQAVVVENQPGAGGIPGTHAMIKSAPDGNTISIIANTHVIAPSVLKSMPFDAIADVTPIAILGSTPFVVVVNPTKVSATNARELASFLKARPGAYNYASSGNGTILHLAGEMLVDELGAEVRHIPYKGVAPMLTDVIGGQVELAVSALPTVQGHLKSGALRAIGLGSATRSPAAPEIPTLAEQGYPNYLAEGWFAAVGPARLPPETVRRLHAAFSAAMAAPEVREVMAKQGNLINVTSPEAAAQFLRSEMARYARLVQKAGLKPD
ncbi:MAG: Bug family tripartite tricarboxylate transporter substrate binding protein [Burkholderiales bacterium]